MKKYPIIPWQTIAGMRNKLVHEYFGVDRECSLENDKGRHSRTEAFNGTNYSGKSFVKSDDRFNAKSIVKFAANFRRKIRGEIRC